MPRPCTICSHPRRAEIDAALASGASLADVVAQFGLPSRTSLHRHQHSHLGRTVTFHMPPTVPVAPAGGVQPVATLDASAELERLFARAVAGPDRSLQDFAHLTLDGLAHVYAAANATGDLGVAVRALRELRALLQFHALVDPDRLSRHPGWRPEPAPPNPLAHIEAWLVAPLASNPAQAEHEALIALAEIEPATAAALAQASEGMGRPFQ